ncbi:MAG: 3-deoxy-D-manno-octulosonic acid transferase [Bacteroidales bacterium]
MFIYNLAIQLLALAVKIMACFKEKEKKLAEGQKKVFSYLSNNRNANDQYIWFHASSLGEFEQGRPMIEKIKREQPKKKILLTFFSPSGYEVRKNYALADMICYLPFDKPANVKRFLDIVNPEKAVFIKYEFWYNYLSELNHRAIPTYIISAIFRPEQLFFKPWGGWYRKMLTFFDQLFVQDNASEELLTEIGIHNVVVCGDTRFDRVIDIMKEAKELSLIDQFAKDQFILVAGSSWPKDEDIFINYFNCNKNMKLIIAPHEIHEEHLKSIESKIKRSFVRYSQIKDQDLQAVDCILIDCFGLLSSIYRYGKVAYIGGGFGVGIHNVLEAAVYGVPVIWGPNYSKFREAKSLINSGGGFSINNAEEFSNLLDKLRGNQSFLNSSSISSLNYVAENAGATGKIYQIIFQ